MRRFGGPRLVAEGAVGGAWPARMVPRRSISQTALHAGYRVSAGTSG